MRRWPTLLIFVSTAITTQKYNRIRHIKKKIAIRDYLVTGTLNFKNEIADNISDVAKEIAKLPIDGKTRSRFGNRSYSGSPEHFDINN